MTVMSSTFQEVSNSQLREMFGPRGESQYCMIVFHMNGCGPCAHVLPMFKVASIGASVPFLSIEQAEAMVKPSTGEPSLMDVSAIVGFPTILWMDRLLPNYITFDGDRSVESIRAFANTCERKSIASRQ